MNDKQKFLYDILDIVVDECSMDIDGEQTVKREDVLGTSRKESAVMTRCIYATEVLFAGYSKDTLAMVLKRSVQAVDNMLKAAHQFRKQSWAYRKAEAEATIKCEQLMQK